VRTEGFDALLGTLKKAAVALEEDGVPFVLGGGLACWVRGGPESDHDLDLMLKHEDADAALEALSRHGFQTEKPPEGWLYKAWDEGVLVDLIFRPTGMPITDEVIERAEHLEVEAMPMRVMTLEDVFVTKLLALDERSLDYESLLEMARPVREQVDWNEVRRRTAESPYARAFFTLVEGLGVVDPVPTGK
jgi:predicted nucleotidyltransferase